MKDFKKLNVWAKAHAFTLSIYKVTNNFPKEEVYGLTSQIRRASASVPTNIAEGCGRKGDAELSRFLQIAFGSSCEVEYQLLLSKELKYLSDDDYQNLITQLIEIKQMLSSFLKKLYADR